MDVLSNLRDFSNHKKDWQLCTIGGQVSVTTEVYRFNEQQDDGTGILHQVAQHPIDQVYLNTRRPCPSVHTQNLERQGTWLQSW